MENIKKNNVLKIENGTINSNPDLLEKLILYNDLSKLSSLEKVKYVRLVCQSVGINPFTNPVKLMKFEGKEQLYFTKDASEQLRKINKISMSKLETKSHEGGLYVVTAYACTPDGRQDSSTGAVSLHGLKGQNAANCMMKAETKAKRRVTLSICGLGFLDETEVSTLENVIEIPMTMDCKEAAILDFTFFREALQQSESLNSLRSKFQEVYRLRDKFEEEGKLHLYEQLVSLKDRKKIELEKEYISKSLSLTNFNDETEEDDILVKEDDDI